MQNDRRETVRQYEKDGSILANDWNTNHACLGKKYYRQLQAN
jgi:hypothetical protein